MSDKQPPTIEHQEPPIYYCWKYWLQNGEIREGCTPIEPENKDSWPDLNNYGWVYIAVPIAIVFVAVFLLYFICSKTGKSKAPTKKSEPLIESDESDDEVDSPAQARWMRAQSRVENGNAYAVPVRSKPKSDFYTVVKMAKPDNNAAPGRKVPPRGGVTAPMQTGQPRIYPHLSAMRRQGARGDEEVTVNGKRVNAASESAFSGGHYVDDPTAATARKNQHKKPASKVLEESSSSEEDDILTENEVESEDENAKEA